jgi:RNA polymerase sigma-70 factor (ECF subfamily)
MISETTFREATDAWPALSVDRETFAAYVRERCRETSDPTPMDFAGMYIACACTLGVKGAVAAFDRAFSREIRHAVARVCKADTDDNVQLVRMRLLVGRNGSPPKIASFSGRGSLRNWVRVCAARTAINEGDPQQREVPTEEEALTVLVGGEVADPEFLVLKAQYRQALKEAAQEAFAELGAQNRNLLRYTLIEGAPLAAIGALYNVHLATAGRWVSRAHETLSNRTRALLRQKLALSTGGLQSLLRVLESQASLSIERYLSLSA